MGKVEFWNLKSFRSKESARVKVIGGQCRESKQDAGHPVISYGGMLRLYP